MVQEIDMNYMLQPQERDENLHVIMFYGATCPPCNNTMPYYEMLAEKVLDKTDAVKFYRINAWEPEEQKNYCKDVLKVEGVPHFKCFFREQNIHSREGGGDIAELSKFLVETIDKIFKDYGVKI